VTSGIEPDATWTAPIVGAPPDDHYVEVEDLDGEVAVEFPLAYEHVNRNGMYDSDDIIAGFACHDDAFTALLYLPRVGDLRLGWWMTLLGLDLGWMVVEGFGTEAPVWLSDAEALDLVLSPDCEFPT